MTGHSNGRQRWQLMRSAVSHQRATCASEACQGQAHPAQKAEIASLRDIGAICNGCLRDSHQIQPGGVLARAEGECLHPPLNLFRGGGVSIAFYDS